MSRITAKDIESFGRVLVALGQLCETQPRRLLDLLSAPLEPDHDDASEREGVEELEALDLFELAAGKKRDELVSALSRYDAQQLRYLLKRYRFGAIKSKSTKVLLDHLVDQVLKRSVDVFKAHE